MPPINVANPSERSYHKNSRFVFWFGACAPTRVLAYGSLEDALESAAEWLIENELLGLITPYGSDEDKENWQDACKEHGISYETIHDHDDEILEKVRETVEMDMTILDSGYLPSWEWGICLENPTKKELIDYYKHLKNWR